MRYLIYVALFCVIACNNSQEHKIINENSSDEEIIINETKNLIIKSPTALAFVNDSTLSILDRFHVYLLNTGTGNLSKTEDKNLLKSLYNSVGLIRKEKEFLTYEEFLETNIMLDINTISMNKTGDTQLLQFSLFEKIDEYKQVAWSVMAYKHKNKVCFLFKNDSLSEFSLSIPLGNFETYLSDSLILAPSIDYFDREQLPDSVSTLLAYRKNQRMEHFYLAKKISLPFSENSNVLSTDGSDDYPYMTRFNFFVYDNSIFFSSGNSIYKLSGDLGITDEIPVNNDVKAFTIINDTVYTIEKDTNKIFTSHCYLLKDKTEITSHKELNLNMNIKACEFWDKTLFVLYLDEEYYKLRLFHLQAV